MNPYPILVTMLYSLESMVNLVCYKYNVELLFVVSFFLYVVDVTDLLVFIQCIPFELTQSQYFVYFDAVLGLSSPFSL